MFSCARIRVEVDLEKGLPKAINLLMEGWNHQQTIDYDHIPYKRKVCHEYRHLQSSTQKDRNKPLRILQGKSGMKLIGKKR